MKAKYGGKNRTKKKWKKELKVSWSRKAHKRLKIEKFKV